MKADYIFLYKYLLCLDEIQSTPHNITLPKVIFSPLYTHIYVRMQSWSNMHRDTLTQHRFHTSSRAFSTNGAL